MTRHLALSAPHVAGEAASSCLSRLAMINGTNAALFSEEQGLRFADVIDDSQRQSALWPDGPVSTPTPVKAQAFAASTPGALTATVSPFPVIA